MSHMSRRSQHPLSAVLVPLLIFFLVLFPKGGIKAAGAPITWGYLLLGVTAVPLLAVRLLVLPLRVSPRTVLAAASLLPFALLFVYSCLANGIALPSYAVAVATNFLFLPAMFLLVYPPFLPMVDGGQFTRWLRVSILIAALWGILLFFLHPLVGRYIEIPYLTVNAADYGTIELTKHIARGRFLKLISTYNNGNVYGAAMLILLPLFDLLESARWKRNTLRLALALTLSRTVWAGLILDQMLSLAAQLPQDLLTFPRVRLGAAARRGAAIVATVGVVGVALLFSSNALQLISDRTLGGRAGELSGSLQATWLPSLPVTGFAEVLYASAASEYGIVGLFSILLIFGGPLALLLLDRRPLAVPSRRAALKGLVLYALISASDGATNLIPVMVFYWFAYMTYLHGLPGESVAAAEARLPQGRRVVARPELAGSAAGAS